MGKRTAVCLFIVLIILASVGDRLADVGISASLFRSLHLVDLLGPLVLLLVVVQYGSIATVLGSRVIAIGWLWIAYVFTFGQLGHFLTGLIGEDGAVVGL